MGKREAQPSLGSCEEEGGIAAVHHDHDSDDDEDDDDDEQAWGPQTNGAAAAGASESTTGAPAPHHHRLRRLGQRQWQRRWCCWQKPPPTGPAAHFWGKLQMALRTALATGAAAVVCLGYWSWAGPEFSWFSIILCIIATRATLGDSLRVACDSWQGAALTVPCAAVLGLVRHSAPLLLLGLFLAVALLVLHPRLPDGGKRLALILLCIVVLTDSPEDTATAYLHKLGLLLLCLLMADLFILAALLAPLPTPALALLHSRGQVVALRRGLHAIVGGCARAFDLGEEVHFSTLEQLLEETTQVLAALKTALPNLRWEMALTRPLPPSTARHAHGRLAAYLAVVEQQLEIMGGLLLSLRRIGPNATHREFARYLHGPLTDLLRAWAAVSDAAARQVDGELGACCCSWGAAGAHGGGRSDGDLRRLLAVTKARHEAFMYELLKARLAIFFGFDMAADEADPSQASTIAAAKPPPEGSSLPPPAPPSIASSTASSSLYYYAAPPRPPPGGFGRRGTIAPSIFEGSEPVDMVLLKRRESSEVYRRFRRDYDRLGAFALLPRNTFLLDVNLLVGTLPSLVEATTTISADATDGSPPLPLSAWVKDRLIGLRAACLLWRGRQQQTSLLRQQQTSLLKRLRLPAKAALSVVLASLGFFFAGGGDVGFKTPWAAIAVAYSITSHPGSSFRSGTSRVQGTVVGGMAGMAALKWLGATDPAAQVAVIALWTFACAWHRASSLYGDAAIVAAFTLPIIMLGPILGEAGALLRVEQTVFGTVIYAAIDNVFWPVRAKIDLRGELAAALGTLAELWDRSFSIFLQRTPDPLAEAARARGLHGRLQASFALQERYIRLALDEPELWHKPFQARAYTRMVNALSQTSVLLAMLVRASNAFPVELADRDRSYHESLLRAVADVAQATAKALEQAQETVRGLTVSKRRRRCSPGGGSSGSSAAKTKRELRSQACTLLRLDEQYARLRDFIDTLMVEHIHTTRTSEGEEATAIVSPHFILCTSGMLFSLDALGRALLRVGHCLRDLVERETGGGYLIG